MGIDDMKFIMNMLYGDGSFIYDFIGFHPQRDYPPRETRTVITEYEHNGIHYQVLEREERY